MANEIYWYSPFLESSGGMPTNYGYGLAIDAGASQEAIRLFGDDPMHSSGVRLSGFPRWLGARRKRRRKVRRRRSSRVFVGHKKYPRAVKLGDEAALLHILPTMRKTCCAAVEETKVTWTAIARAHFTGMEEEDLRATLYRDDHTIGDLRLALLNAVSEIRVAHGVENVRALPLFSHAWNHVDAFVRLVKISAARQLPALLLGSEEAWNTLLTGAAQRILRGEKGQCGVTCMRAGKLELAAPRLDKMSARDFLALRSVQKYRIPSGHAVLYVFSKHHLMMPPAIDLYDSFETDAEGGFVWTQTDSSFMEHTWEWTPGTRELRYDKRLLGRFTLYRDGKVYVFVKSR